MSYANIFGPGAHSSLRADLAVARVGFDSVEYNAVFFGYLPYWPCNFLYAINNSSWAETRANRVRTNYNQLLLSDGSDAYSTVYAILQYGVRIRINECTASDAVRIGCVRIGINSAGGL